MLGYVLCSFLDANGLLSSALTIFSTSSAGSSCAKNRSARGWLSRVEETYLGRVEREGHGEGVNVLDVEHGRVDDADPCKELRVRAGEHGDFASPCNAMRKH